MTTKRPWMPLYIATYLKSTTHLGALESGAYLHLIMDYWQNGRLPTDDRQLARIAKMTDREWKTAKPLLAAFFSKGWRHQRVDAELAKAVDISSKRRAAAEEKHSKRDANAGANAHANAGANAGPFGGANAGAIDPANAHTLYTSQRKDPSQGKITPLRPELVEGGGARSVRNGEPS